MPRLPEKVLKYIRDHALVTAGERVGVAVSGGPDSVALLRILLELRQELGIVVAVAHFNHKIRGADSDADQKFVAVLAERHGLELHAGSDDTQAHARAHKQSLETAARELRYKFFYGLLRSARLSKIATGHTLDDQAETVLMRLIRGAGTKGLAGIYPAHGGIEEGAAAGPTERSVGHVIHIVRPLLCLRRSEIESYLKSLRQPWREDLSNRDPQHLRNRIRHQLLPILQADFNPAIVRVLAETAEIARGEEAYWTARVAEILPSATLPESGLLKIKALRKLPVALQRRVLRVAAERCGLTPDFDHVEELQALLRKKPSLRPQSILLPRGEAELRAGEAGGELRLRQRSPNRNDSNYPDAAVNDVSTQDYEYCLKMPGEVRIAETGSLIRARMVPATALPELAGDAGGNRYNRAQLFDPHRLAAELTVRNWRAGDRYWPARRKSARKVKELLQRVPRAQRRLWPVVVSGTEIVWMRGFPPPSRFTLPLTAAKAGGEQGLVIEELRLEPGREGRP